MIHMILTVVMLLSITACSGSVTSESKNSLSQWKSDGVVTKITGYMESVTNEKSSDFIPTDEMIEVAGKILYAARDKNIPEDVEEKESRLFGKVFDGMTTDEYDEYVRRFLEQDADGFENLKYCEAYFRPMAELIQYLDFRQKTCM